jgi:aspartyl protease family protein
VRQRLLWLLLIGVAIVILLLMVHRHAGTIGPLANRDLSSLAYKIVILVFVAGTVLTLFREPFTRAIAAALLWIVIALVLVVGYSYRFELHDIGERVLAELIPGRVISHGRTVEVARANSGDFDISAQINGARIAMVLDTGANSIVLTPADARAAGLPLELLSYTVRIDTANGRTRAAPVTLDRVAVGGLIERSIQALVAQPGQLKMSLLGMSFLNRLHSWEVRGDRLLLRGYP